MSQVLFRLSRSENLRTCPRKFDQNAKDPVVCLVEDRIVAENMSMHPACQAVASKSRLWSGSSMNTGIVSLPEFICKTLKNNRAGGFITSRGYRQSKARGLSAGRLRDAVLVERISAVHRDNSGV